MNEGIIDNIMFAFILVVQAVWGAEICKSLNVSTNIKKSKDDIISKGVPAK